MKKVKRTQAEAWFWIFGIAAVLLAFEAINTMDVALFWAAAFHGLMSMAFYLYDSRDE